jgi:hypothetical protein
MRVREEFFACVCVCFSAIAMALGSRFCAAISPNFDSSGCRGNSQTDAWVFGAARQRNTQDLESSLNWTIMSGGHLVSSKTCAGSTGSGALFPESRIACCCPQTLRVSRKWNCTSDLKHSTSRICCRRPIIDKGHVRHNFNVFKHGTFLRMTDYGWQPKRYVKMAVHSGSDSVTDPILVAKRGRNPLWSFFESARYPSPFLTYMLFTAIVTL